MPAMTPGSPPSARTKLVAGFTNTRRSTNSGAAAATRRPKQPPKDSATIVTYRLTLVLKARRLAAACKLLMLHIPTT